MIILLMYRGQPLTKEKTMLAEAVRQVSYIQAINEAILIGADVCT